MGILLDRFLIIGTILTSGQAPIKNGAVLVHGSIIKQVGTFEETHNWEYDTVIGSEDHLIIPGFVNTHAHAVQTFFRGAAENLELLDWLEQVILPGEGTLTSEELYASCRIGYAEMLLSGITTVNDMMTAHHSKKGLQAAIDSGIRGKIGKMLMDRNVPDTLHQPFETIVREVEELASLYPNGGRIEFSLTPRFIITCSDELMQFASKFAKEHGLLFHTHAAENRAECSTVHDLTGKSYIHAMDSLNCLGSHVILAHCVWTSESERDLLKTTHTSVSHNPSSNSKLGSGIAPIPDYLQHGIPLGLASDGSPATGGHDMFLEMKLAAYLQRASHTNSSLMSAETVFDMATRQGALAMGYDDVGEIKPGFKADIVLLNLSLPNAHPLYDYYSYIVFTATKSDIDTVMVDGKILVKEGTLVQDIQASFDIAKEYAREKPFVSRNGENNAR